MFQPVKAGIRTGSPLENKCQNLFQTVFWAELHNKVAWKNFSHQEDHCAQKNMIS